MRYKLPILLGNFTVVVHEQKVRVHVCRYFSKLGKSKLNFANFFENYFFQAMNSG